jgi:hypothetical protein
MSELERLEKAVKDTEAAYSADFDAGNPAPTSTAYAAYVKAAVVLIKYKKEQDNG